MHQLFVGATVRTNRWTIARSTILAAAFFLLAFLVQPPSVAAQSKDRNNPTPLDGADINGMVSTGNAGDNYYFSFNADRPQVSFTLTVEGGFGPGSNNQVSFEVFDDRGKSLTTGAASAMQGQSEQFLQRLNVTQRQRLVLKVMIAPRQTGNGKYTLRIGGSASFGPPLVPSGTGSGSGPIVPTVYRIGALSWLTGCWRSTSTNPNVITERWSPLAGNMMMGVGQTVNGNTTVEFEYTRMVQDGANVFFIAKPSQNPDETAFRLIRLAGQEAVFENPEHDFPQRVIYRRTGDNLTGRIEGNNNGRTMAIDFPMIKVRCE